MSTFLELFRGLESGDRDAQLAALYGPENIPSARSRAVRVTKALLDRFAPSGDAALFSGPGRTEIGGNHTDHQHGHVLCGSVDMDMLACAAPNGLRMVRIVSEGYPAL